MMLSQRSHSFVLQEEKYFPVDLIESEVHMFYIRMVHSFRCIQFLLRRVIFWAVLEVHVLPPVSSFSLI